MCTATWIVRPGGYDLLFSRDERRTRAPAAPPRVVRAGGVRAIRPTDADAGGTWIGVNARGVALALLNRYVAAGTPAGAAVDADRPSRGTIPAALLGASSAADALARLEATDLSAYRPFDLLAFEPDAAPRCATWDGRALAVARLSDADRPVVSTSFRGADVRGARREAYRRIVGTGTDLDRLAAYHASHEPERGPASPCMHRDDARTVSLSRVTVEPARVLFRYAPGPPCRTPFDGDGVALERA